MMQVPALQLGAVLRIQLTEAVRALTNVFSVMLPIHSGKAFYLLFILLAPLCPRCREVWKLYGDPSSHEARGLKA